MTLRTERLREVQATARRIFKGRDRYEKVSSATGVPWFVVGLIHAMEAGLSFDDHLHNGDPLDERTVHVPRGRPKQGTPPFTWEDSAIDALGYDGLTVIDNWCVERIAFMLESYNGWGYRGKGVPTPYLWSYTNQYEKGKFVRDHVFDANAVSEQSGAMAILTAMRDLETSIPLTFFNGNDAAHDPKTPVMPPPGLQSEKPRSTLPGDALTVASGVGITATVATHQQATPAPAKETAAAQEPSPAPQPTPQSAPVQQPQTPPASQPAPATKPIPPTVPHPAQVPMQTKQSTAQPLHPVSAFVHNNYSLILGLFGALLVTGLFLALRARKARGHSAQRFIHAVPQLISRAASGEDLSSAPLVQKTRTRFFTVAWVLATIVVNVVALAKLLQEFGWAPLHWYPPFTWFGGIYDDYAQRAFNAVASAMNTQTGLNLAQWPWLLPFMVLYVSTASAFMVANSGLMQRKTSAETLWGAVVHAGWILAIPSFIMDAVRYRVVTQFARQNTILFFAYVAFFVGCYAGVRFINDDFLAAYTQTHPDAIAAYQTSIATLLHRP